MKKIITILAVMLTGQSWAQIRDFQTTRLNSTAGAGVASILSTEAAILNPASASFFGDSSASAQSYTTALKKKNDLRSSGPQKFAKRNNSTGYFVADHSGEIKGGLAYIQQAENKFDRERMIFHAAAPMGADASVGISYNYIQDKLPRTFNGRHRTHHQMRLGTTFIASEKTTLGFVLVDPTRTNPGDERVLLGIQQGLTDSLTLIADGGSQYSKDMKKKSLWNVALQVSLFDDFFVRGGRFYDNIRFFRGFGWGAGWVGPRFGIEFAQKFSDSFGKNTYIYKKESLVDTSLSLILKF